MPTISRGPLSIYYESHGDGDPLVFVGGLGVHLGYWAPLLGYLGGRRKILIDHRGTGRSTSTPEPYTVADLAEDVLAVLDALQIEQADWVGHSMGGYVVMHIAAHAPSRVRRAVLYSTSATLNWASVRFIESIERVWAECPQVSTAALSRIFLPWNWSPRILSDDKQVELLVQTAELNPYKMTRESFGAQLAAARGFDAASLLPRIEAPVLVVAGRHDLLAPLEHQRAMVDRLSHAQLEVSEAAHNTHLEETEWFARTVTGFLEHVFSSGAT